MTRELIQPSLILSSSQTKAFVVSIQFLNKLIFQAYIAGDSGALLGAIDIYGSNDDNINSNPSTASLVWLATLNLSGTGSGLSTIAGTDFIAVTNPWKYFYINLKSISGTNAIVKLSGSVN